VAQGGLKGRTVTTAAGITYYSFQGIPYAKPPVGPLRFQVRRVTFASYQPHTVICIILEYGSLNIEKLSSRRRHFDKSSKGKAF